MRVTRAPKMLAEIKNVINIKNKVRRLLREKIEFKRDLQEPVGRLQDLYDQLGSLFEIFKISTQLMDYKQVDRCGNMLSGPFFVSAQFPVPKNELIDMFPIIQFDLAVLSRALKVEMGSGLIQIWYDLLGKEEYIRIIPEYAIKPGLLIDYQVASLQEGDKSGLLPRWIERDPMTGGVSIIRGLVSRGIDYDHLSIQSYYELFDSRDDWLILVFLKYFGRKPIKKDHSSLMIGGTLYNSKNQDVDIKMRQLMKLDGWGASGSAEIFFRLRKKLVNEYFSRS